MVHYLRGYQAVSRLGRLAAGLKKPALGLLSGLLLASGPALAQSGRYEAENAQVFGSASVGSNWGGYSGSGFTENMTTVGSATRFTVTAATEGQYYVTLRYATGGWGGSQTLSVYVNGVDVTQTVLNSTLGWSDWASKMQVLTLNAGSNTIEYRYDSGDSGWVNLDYMWLTRRAANGPLEQPITTGDQLVVSKFLQLPTANTPNAGPSRDLIGLTYYDNQLVVAEHTDGIIYKIVDDPSAPLGKRTEVFFNVQQGVDGRNGGNNDTKFNHGPWNALNQNYDVSAHGGLRGVAFPPGFTNPSSPFYGKFYTSLMETAPASQTGHYYLHGATTSCGYDGVVAEWTYNFSNPQASTYREILRVSMPVYDHAVKHLAFNPYAQPGDEDYGLLYIAHGDGSVQSATLGAGGQGDNGLGKILRINPLLSGSAIAPASNPFYNSLNWYTKEVYARGFRNPHTFSFTKDASNTTRLIVGEAGRDNVEEVNLVAKGGNYGWPLREGHFEHFQVEPGGGAIQGVSPLPVLAPAAQYEFEYPAAQWGHNITSSGGSFVGQAGVGGYAYTNPADGRKYYMYADFVSSGRIFYSDLQDMVGTTRQLSYGQSPQALTQAATKEFTILYDHDNNHTTPAQRKYSLRDVLSSDLGGFVGRLDLRFGQGPNGEIYLLTKRDGLIYKVDRVVPASGATATYEAEDAILTSPAAVGNQWSNFRAQGFVEFMNSSSNASVYYDNVVVPTTGMYLVDLRYAAANGGNLHIYVNGVNKGLYSFPATAGWSSWSNQVLAVQLPAGRNTIKYQVDAGDVGNINLDYIQVRPNTYEAEDAQFNTNAANYFANYRGSGFVENLTSNGTYVSFQVTVPTAGSYDVDLRYAAAITNSTRSMSVYVNGVDVQQAQFPSTNDWNTWATQISTLSLNAGTNTIMYRMDAGDAGWINLDYINIREACPGSITLSTSLLSLSNCDAEYRISVTNSTNANTSYRWYVDGNYDPSYDDQSYYDVLLYVGRTSAVVTVQAGSTCGGPTVSAQRTVNRVFKPSACRPAVTSAYPNPADTYLNVVVPGVEAQSGRSLQGQPRTEQPATSVRAELYNQYGLLVRSASGTSAQPPQLDTSTLPEGFYHVMITQTGQAVQ